MASQKLVQIWHNPNCSKSRQTLALLEEQNIQLDIVEYLKDSPSCEMIKQALTLLQLAPRQLMRQNESIYSQQRLDNPDLNDDDLIKAMNEFPALIQRPVVIIDSAKAGIGRPPESILDLLK